MNSETLLFLANHLWQSTLFAATVWLMTLVLRNNRAAVRHRLWFAASIKFLIPFSALVAFGTHFQWRTAPAEPVLIGQIATPFVAASIVPEQPEPSSRIPEILAVVWILGVIVNMTWWLTGWLRLRGIIRKASALDLGIPLRVMSCSERLEPGVFGILRPVLLLPAGITDRLSPEQFQTVVAHEICHVRRRDNLTAAIHLLVEALFWFHPLLWWIKSRLIAEQERACDEEVLHLGNDPHVYAESILKLCEFYIASPLICAAGVTGSNLKRRIEEIMNNRVARPLSSGKSLALAAVATAALAVPVMIGAGGVKAKRPEMSKKPAEIQPPELERLQAAPVRGAAPGAYLRALGTVVASNTVTVTSRVDGQLMSVSFKEGDMVAAGQLLASIDRRPFELQL
ncbi:MAG TPA: M56 family metallopeptidase, partial [Terriglobia bacterium]